MHFSTGDFKIALLLRKLKKTCFLDLKYEVKGHDADFRVSDERLVERRTRATEIKIAIVPF
jgi:hypothetical protein